MEKTTVQKNKKNRKLSKDLRKQLFETGLERLCDWADKRGWITDFSYTCEDEMEPGNKMIYINTRQSVEKQLYSMIHECGHVLVQSNVKAYYKKYPATAESRFLGVGRMRKLEKTKKYKIDTIAEEIEAWDRGKKLARRLELYIDEDNYTKLMYECVYTYVDWAARGKSGDGKRS
jgi:hypothetical protein